MAGTAMAVPLLGSGEDSEHAWQDAYRRFEARQKAQEAWLAEFDRASRTGSRAAVKHAPGVDGWAIADEDRVTLIPAWRRALGIVCVIGIPVCSTASAEFGKYMETRLAGGAYAHGYVVSWANHSILIVFLIPWAMIVASENGCSCSGLWRAMVEPYGTTKRLIGVTFWLSFQYQLFNYAYWSWLPLASVSSSQTIAQSQCIFVFIFSMVILEERFSLGKFILVLLCVAGVAIMVYGDSSSDDGGGSGSSSESAGSSNDAANPPKTGSMGGDLLLLLPSMCNALYAVEWKRLVPGVQARDSLVGLGLLAAWHLVFWVWGIWITQALVIDGPKGDLMPTSEQLVALIANAGIAACFNFCFMMGSTLAGPVPIIVGGAMAVPMTYCFDMVVRGLYFSPLSLVGALVVFVSFVMLNAVELYERSVETAGIRKRKEDAKLHRSQSNSIMEAAFSDIDSNSVRVN